MDFGHLNQTLGYLGLMSDLHTPTNNLKLHCPCDYIKSSKIYSCLLRVVCFVNSPATIIHKTGKNNQSKTKLKQPTYLLASLVFAFKVL